MAYTDEGNGERRYLCEDHMPQEDVDGDKAPPREQ